MRVAGKINWLARLGALYALLTVWAAAQTAIIFVADDDGNVGRIVAGQSTGTVVGSLSASGFTAGQVIGLAYDSQTNGILIFDRSAQTVYTMDASSGQASVLFTTPGVEFQGGAVFGGLVYGIDEETERLKAYSFGGVEQSLPNVTDLTGHIHGLGTDPVNHRLVYLNEEDAIRSVNTDGSDGSVILSNASLPFAEDLAYFEGDYLVADYSRQLLFLDGQSGSTFAYLSDTELTTMGITGSVSGVVLEYVAVPEPSTWAMMALGIAVVGWIASRRRSV